MKRFIIKLTLITYSLMRLIFFLKKKIIIFRPDELGDLVLWLDAAKALRNHYPKDKYNIILLGKPALKSFLCQCPYWDKVIDLDLRKYGLSLLYRIRSIFVIAGANIVINPLVGRPFMIDHLIGYSGVKKRIGIDVKWNEISRTTENTRIEGNACYSELIKLDLTRHISEINISFVNHICQTNYAANLDSIDFKKKSDKEHGTNELKYCVVIPGAGGAGRCWEISKFSELINKLHDYEPNLQVIICGVSTEKKIADKIITGVKQIDKVINNCGRTDLVKLVNIVKNSKFVIGNDTGTIHLAPCLKIPSVCILGGGHFGLFHPYSSELTKNVYTKAVFRKMDCYHCTWSCYKATTFDIPHPCISAISVDEVWENVIKILDKQ